MARVINETALGQVWLKDQPNSPMGLKDITSNGLGNLLQHPEKMALIQAGDVPSPIMVHLALTNICDITCDTCCYADRKFKESIALPLVKLAIDHFANLGVTGLELTGGGEPTMYPEINEVIEHAAAAGLEIGLCTNGKRLDKIKNLEKFQWVRIGMYGFDEGYNYDEKIIQDMRDKGVDVTGAYIWAARTDTVINPNIVGGHTDVIRRLTARKTQTNETFENMLAFVEANKIPTRIAVDAIRPTSQVVADYQYLDSYMEEKHPESQYAKVSIDRYIPGRANDNCYMWMVKPFISPWGTDGGGVVVDCPSTVLSPENGFKVNPRFVVCTIEEIPEYYGQGAKRRQQPCQYCNFSRYNGQIDAMVTPKKHNGFA